MISGPSTSIVVPLVGDLESLLDSFLEEKYENEDDRKAVKDEHRVRYGIVDGCQFHCTIVKLRFELSVKWGTFKWTLFNV